MGSNEPWVGVREVAIHLGVARDSVYRWVESKALPAHRVGRLLRFRLSEVDGWVATGSGQSAPSRDSFDTRTPRHAKRKSEKGRDR
jgi:excisionase family DNA binding protein